MKINELLMNIHNKEFNLERGLQIKKYIPMEAKKTIAQGIMYECITEEDGLTKIDSVQRYMSYVKYMITMHTNLEYTDENYDVLCSTVYGETTLLNAIMKHFEVDATECSRILNLMTDDYMQERSIENSVGQFLHRLNNYFSSISGALTDNINNLDLTKILPKDYDAAKINDFLKNYMK